jgi:hypothetical protein
MELDEFIGLLKKLHAEIHNEDADQYPRHEGNELLENMSAENVHGCLSVFRNKQGRIIYRQGAKDAKETLNLILNLRVLSALAVQRIDSVWAAVLTPSVSIVP